LNPCITNLKNLVFSASLLIGGRQREYGTNGNNGTNENILLFRLFRYFRLFRTLSSFLWLRLRRAGLKKVWPLRSRACENRCKQSVLLQRCGGIGGIAGPLMPV
jgi:hypothetical protein